MSGFSHAAVRLGLRIPVELRRFPPVRGLADLLVPREGRTCARVARGAGSGIWLSVATRVPWPPDGPEPHVQSALCEVLKPGATFCDVGANLGFFSLLAARLVGPYGRVYAFEPDPQARQWLEEASRRNRLAIDIVGVAVWHADSMVPFRRANPAHSPDLGTGAVVRNHRTPGTIAVRAVTLDGFFAARTNRIEEDLVIKVDAEGSELAVLQGAAGVLASRRAAWIVEVHEPHGAEPVEAIFAHLGYSVRPLLGDRSGQHLFAIP